MQSPILFKFLDETFWLSPERSVYWEEEKTLIVSDLHFGKTGHFRKAGIAVPQGVFKEDLQRLIAHLQYYQPKILLVVGDLFHSVANKELELFCKWRDDLPGLTIKLVKGNHDILKDNWYETAGIEMLNNGLLLKGFCFTHDNQNCQMKSSLPDGAIRYMISGHIHPGIQVKGLGKQSLCLPCFYFGHSFAVLPAFSRFTGTALIEPKGGDTVFAIADNHIIKIR